jgi:hypothetical protein
VEKGRLATRQAASGKPRLTVEFGAVAVDLPTHVEFKVPTRSLAAVTISACRIYDSVCEIGKMR